MESIDKHSAAYGLSQNDPLALLIPLGHVGFLKRKFQEMVKDNRIFGEDGNVPYRHFQKLKKTPLTIWKYQDRS